MNILHAILSEGFYGSERHCIELATAQAISGHQVEVLIHDGGSRCARVFRDAVSAAEAAIATRQSAGAIRLAVIPRPMPALVHRLFARWILRRFSPDIVHTHLNPANRRVGRVAHRRGIPHVATLHIRYEAREHSDCDGLICGAAWQQAEIGPEFRGDVKVVWPWLPATVGEALARVTSAEIAGLRRDWRADDRTVVLGSIGRLMPEKGMDLLVRAFRLAFPHGDEPARLVILGVGAQEQELRRLVDGDTRIALIGPQPEIAHYYRAFDVYVSASRFEPFGLTILEAMEAGCPLVVTRTEGPREFLKNANVLWTEPNDVAMLGSQLRAATAQGRKRDAYDMSPFARQNAVAAIEALYRLVLKRRTCS